MKKAIEWFSGLDRNEKNFMLVAFTFLLVALFVLLSGQFYKDFEDESERRVYVGFKEADIENIKLTELQISACRSADKYKSCGNLEETYLVTSGICCVKMEACCDEK